MAEEFCGRHLLGHVTRSGPVRHRSLRPLSLQELRPNGEIAPALLFAGKMKEKLSGQALVGYVIREALAKNWPVPESLRISAEGISPKEELGSRDILVTRFKVLEIQKGRNEGVLEVLSQKANGDVFMEGQIKLIFLE
jgi:hypothetical protein